MDSSRWKNPCQRGRMVQIVDDIHHHLDHLSILTDACPALDGLLNLEHMLKQERRLL